MKKIFIPVLAMAMLAACKGKSDVTSPSLEAFESGTFSLTGKVSGIDSGFLELMYPLGDANHTDTLKITKGGNFSFETKLPEPLQMMVRIPNTRGSELVFFADPGKLSINGSKDSLWAADVKGGATQTLFKEVEVGFKGIMGKGEALYQQYQQANQAGDTGQMKRLEGQFVEIQNNARKYANDFAFKNRGTILAAYLGLAYLGEEGNEAELKKLYDTLSPAVRKSFFGKKINEVVTAVGRTKVGAVAPDFTQPDVNGNPIALTSLRGKYVLVDFWASWCKPCREENPNVVKAYNMYKNKNFTILGVSLDQDKAAWQKAIASDGLTWTQVGDMKYWQNDAARLYNIQSIPANMLIDPAGVIVAKDLRGEALEQALAGFIK
jgi:peroxiredoxin